MLALGAGVAVTGALIGLAALVAGGVPGSESAGRPSLGPPQRWLAALTPLSVVAGTSAALGILQGNALLLIGALIGCTYVRWSLSSSGGAPGLLPGFLAVSWAVLAGFLRFETLDTQALQGAQAVLGPTVMLSPPIAAVGACAAMIGGVAGGFQWVISLPALGSPSMDRAFVWAEAVLAGSVVSGTLWGPSLGVLLMGPRGDIGMTLVSFGVGVLSILSIAIAIRSLGKRTQGTVIRWVPAGLALGGSVLVVLAR